MKLDKLGGGACPKRLKTPALEGSADETIEDRREGESERRLRRKVTCEGALCYVRS